jgi:hypothetical protein
MSEKTNRSESCNRFHKSEAMTDPNIELVLKNPITTHAMLNLLIEQGVKLSKPVNDLTHSERVEVIRQIMRDLESREAMQ